MQISLKAELGIPWNNNHTIIGEKQAIYSAKIEIKLKYIRYRKGHKHTYISNS